MAKKKRRVVITIEVETECTVRDLRKATDFSLDGGGLMFRFCKDLEGEPHAEQLVQVQVNEVTKG